MIKIISFIILPLFWSGYINATSIPQAPRFITTPQEYLSIKNKALQNLTLALENENMQGISEFQRNIASIWLGQTDFKYWKTARKELLEGFILGMDILINQKQSKADTANKLNRAKAKWQQLFLKAIESDFLQVTNKRKCEKKIKQIFAMIDSVHISNDLSEQLHTIVKTMDG